MTKTRRLGLQIRKFRERAGMSQLDLETAVDASTGSISRMENGKVNPTKESIIHIAKALELSDSDIAGLFGIEIIDPLQIALAMNAISLPLVQEEVIQQALNEISHRLKYNTVAIFLLDSNQTLWAHYINNNTTSKEKVNRITNELKELHVSRVSGSNNLILKAALDNTSYDSENMKDFAIGAVASERLKTLLASTNIKRRAVVPISVNSRAIGAMYFSKKDNISFHSELPILIALANQVGIAIRNSELAVKK